MPRPTALLIYSFLVSGTLRPLVCGDPFGVLGCARSCSSEDMEELIFHPRLVRFTTRLAGSSQCGRARLVAPSPPRGAFFDVTKVLPVSQVHVRSRALRSTRGGNLQPAIVIEGAHSAKKERRASDAMSRGHLCPCRRTERRFGVVYRATWWARSRRTRLIPLSE